jgi:hypothetical protein
MFKKLLPILFLFAGFQVNTAHALLLTSELDADAYVTLGSYDLAWASPCSDGILESSCGSVDLSVQAAYGWSIMDSALFSSLSVDASTFAVGYSSSNTQLASGINYAKAAGWFTNHGHIDVSDGLNGNWSFVDVADANSYMESIVYRKSAGAVVPEPSIIALFGLGLVGIGFAGRRRQSS